MFWRNLLQIRGPQETPTGRESGHPLTIEFLRVGIGVIWFLNLLFILLPQNRFFPLFGQTAQDLGTTSLGGPGLADFVAVHASTFVWVVALMTVYLTMSFLLGVTTRLACLVGGIFSAVLIGVQVGNTFTVPGGTDVGEHPLYLLIYGILLVGGAGFRLSLTPWLLTVLRGVRLPVARRAAAVPAAFSVSSDLSTRAMGAYFIAGVLLAFGVGLGLVATLPVPPGSSNGAPAHTVTTYENLSVFKDNVTGHPYFFPANFTVAIGKVVFTINDQDDPVAWDACPCRVTGTAGSVEWMNGSAFTVMPNSNIAHTFDIPTLGLNVATPGAGSIQFTLDLTNPGQFVWYCLAPCGGGTNPYTTFPMGTDGWMSGTMTVV